MIDHQHGPPIKVKGRTPDKVRPSTTGPAALTFDGGPATQPTRFPTGYGVPAQGHDTTEYGSLWGVPVCESTQCPAGTGVVLSVKAGAAVGFSHNLYSWRAEERISLTTPRPSAINIVTGLPTS